MRRGGSAASVPPPARKKSPPPPKVPVPRQRTGTFSPLFPKCRNSMDVGGCIASESKHSVPHLAGLRSAATSQRNVQVIQRPTVHRDTIEQSVPPEFNMHLILEL